MTEQSFKARTTSVLIPDASATLSGVVNTTTQTFAGAKTFSGYSSFGNGNVGLQCKRLSGTTAAAEGGSVNIAHGLTSSKILGINVLVFFTSTAAVPPGNPTTGYQYKFDLGTTDLTIVLDATNSENILSKTIEALVWYMA